MRHVIECSLLVICNAFGAPFLAARVQLLPCAKVTGVVVPSCMCAHRCPKAAKATRLWRGWRSCGKEAIHQPANREL